METEIIVFILLFLIGFMFVDHYRIHGYFYDPKDFQDAVFYLFKSHEGVIVFVVILLFGIVIGAST